MLTCKSVMVTLIMNPLFFLDTRRTWFVFTSRNKTEMREADFYPYKIEPTASHDDVSDGII